MRRRKLKRLWARLRELQARQRLTRDELLLSLGAAKKEAGQATSLRDELDRDKLRQVRRREGRYLLRSNLRAAAPETLWEQYLLLTRIEQAFKDRKGELAIRPVHHQRDERTEAHIFVSFLAYWWHATLRNLARRPAGGLSPRAILEKLSAMQMIDEHLPTTGGKHIVLSRYREPEADAGLLLAQLQIPLPAQSPPKADAPGKMAVECRPKENKH